MYFHEKRKVETEKYVFKDWTCIQGFMISRETNNIRQPSLFPFHQSLKHILDSGLVW